MVPRRILPPFWNREDSVAACATHFKLAVAVLKRDYTQAVLLMKRIGAAGDLGEQEYKAWPLFHRFRDTPEFRVTFQRNLR